MTHTTSHRRTRRLVAAGTLAATGLLLTSGGVYAALNATAFNTTAQASDSGTLRLTMTNNGVGFSTAVSNLAPGDVVNRYVTLVNGGTLDAAGLTLGVADGAAANRLTNDATSGLKVSVTSCPTAWTPGTGAGSGTCATAPTTLLTNVALATLKTAPSSLSATPVAAGASTFLRLAVTLPDQAETTVNGVLPTGTIQGLSASLTWTFTETQRAATTTTS